jgi:hypothetical protein
MIRPRKRARFENLSEALVEDACPVCSLLKEFQSSCLTELDRHEVNRLCGFHVWMVAKVAEARSAAALFLHLTERSLPQDSAGKECDVCDRVAQEERRCVKEFGDSLDQPPFLHWLQQQGALCIPHGRKLLSEVSKRQTQEAIVLAMKNRKTELRRRLTDLLRRAESRQPTQAGILGKVAEYLVAQRGLSIRS